jgi:hypothetical protein
MHAAPNPFAVLIDPIGVLSACAKSGSLEALPVSARHDADRLRLIVEGDLAQHDANVDQIYAEAIAKASKQVAKAKAKT